MRDLFLNCPQPLPQPQLPLLHVPAETLSKKLKRNDRKSTSNWTANCSKINTVNPHFSVVVVIDTLG